LYVACAGLLALLGTVDYQLDDGTVVFRTCDAERDKVVFQVVRFIPICCFVVFRWHHVVIYMLCQWKL